MRNWTDQQKLAISTSHSADGSGCNILVGAAAGSGKTAVLVERIIKKLLPENGEKGIDADKLLVVTFTNAAAREMKERIEKALSEELKKTIADCDTQRAALIRRQQLILPSADITTIDSFCLKLVRRYFNLLNIDPGFSVADESQAAIISEDAMEDLFSELYETEDEDFEQLLSLYASSRSDEPLADLIRYVYKFLRAVPNPTDWLDTHTDELKKDVSSTLWYNEGLRICRSSISYALSCTEKALELMCETPYPDAFLRDNPPEKGVNVFDEWKNYYKAFYTDYFYFKELLTLPPDSAAEKARHYVFPRFAALKSKPEEEKNYLKELRTKAKDSYYRVHTFLTMDTDDMNKMNKLSKNELYPAMRALSKLIKKYDSIFMEKKRNKNLLEFSDVEQLANVLLSENPEIADELKNDYAEILMDEYQDTNALQEEIFSHITNGENLFTVGDMKQSIYRFRSSDPTIFKAKSDSYSQEDGAKNRKIILSQNFRSRKEVLESVNDVFANIMSEEAGELDYDSDQRLYYGNTTYKQVNPDYTSKCIIIKAPQDDNEEQSEYDDYEDISYPKLEASAIAAEINRLKREHFKVRDGDNYRDIENRDIVILMSSYKSVADTFTEELTGAGIECFAESTGYFEKNEVRLILSLLKTINNPYTDIPLLGVLRSPIGCFTDNELAYLRKIKKGRFYGTMKEFSAFDSADLSEPEQNLHAKVLAFIEKLQRWRSYSRIMPTDKLIWTLYEESGYYAYAGTLYNGEEVQANLRLLFERANQYENSGFQGLFSFIKYVDNLERKDTDLSSAKLVGEGHNVVRIMTIHKSKGLEFPVVFIAGINKRFRKTADESRVILHRKYGIAPDYINPDESYRYSPPSKDIFKLISASEQTSEEIRKLYVAATRAKELLYAVGAVSGSTESGENKYILSKKQQLTDGKCSFSPQEVLNAKSFADWLVPVSMSSDNWIFTELNYDEINSVRIQEAETAEEFDTSIDIERILNYKYKYKAVSDLPTKLSASDLDESDIHIIPKPAFLNNDIQTGADYGTALHAVMEHLIPTEDMDAEYVKNCISDLINRGILQSGSEDVINPEKILKFYRSELGKRIIKSPHVYREQYFETEANAELIYPDAEDIIKGEKIIIQGKIDCYFEEDGRYILVDYKTDRYTNASEIHEKYDRQLNAYAYALQKISKKSVKEKYFYLFFDNSVV